MRNENVHVKRDRDVESQDKAEGSEPRRKISDLGRSEHHLRHYVLGGHPVSQGEKSSLRKRARITQQPVRVQAQQSASQKASAG